jgi:hypothetical protein
MNKPLVQTLRTLAFSMPARSREGVRFIEPMECLAAAKLPDGPQWVYEIKLDGRRIEAVRSNDGLTVHSRNGKSLNKEFPYNIPFSGNLFWSPPLFHEARAAIRVLGQQT